LLVVIFLFVMDLNSAVTVSIFGFAVGFGRLFDKNRGSGSVLVFIGPDFNHVQSRERTIIGSVSYPNRYWVYVSNCIGFCCIGENPHYVHHCRFCSFIGDNRSHYTG